MDPGVSAEVSVPSYPTLPPEASSHSHTAPSLNPHPHETQQDQTSSGDQGPERTEGGGGVSEYVNMHRMKIQSQFVTCVSGV